MNLPNLDHLSSQQRARVEELLSLMQEGQQLQNLLCWNAEQRGDEPPTDDYKRWIESAIARLQTKAKES